MKLKVADDTQVNFDGTTYGPGAELEVPDDHPELAVWLAHGWAKQLGGSKGSKESSGGSARKSSAVAATTVKSRS